MNVDFQVLESQLTETEMALFMMVNVAMNAAFAAGANMQLVEAHLDQHQQNFGNLGKKKAEHMTAAIKMLVANVIKSSGRR